MVSSLVYHWFISYCQCGSIISWMVTFYLETTIFSHAILGDCVNIRLINVESTFYQSDSSLVLYVCSDNPWFSWISVIFIFTIFIWPPIKVIVLHYAWSLSWVVWIVLRVCVQDEKIPVGLYYFVSIVESKPVIKAVVVVDSISLIWLFCVHNIAEISVHRVNFDPLWLSFYNPAVGCTSTYWTNSLN